MNYEASLRATEPASESPEARCVRISCAARRIAGVATVVAIVTSFIEAAVNPAASFSALHFWLALFVAAATRSDEGGDSCRS